MGPILDKGQSFSAIWISKTLSKLWGVKKKKWHLFHSLKLKFNRTPVNPNIRHSPINGLSYTSPSFFIKTIIISHHNQNFSKWKWSVPNPHRSLTLSLSPSFSLIQLKSLLHLFLSFFSLSLFNWSQPHSTNAPSACPPLSFHCFPLSWRHSLQTSLILPFPFPSPFSLSAFPTPHPTCPRREPPLHTLLFVAILVMKTVIFAVISVMKPKMILLMVISVTNTNTTIPFAIIFMTKTETTSQPFSRFVFH